jgi:hypothetical protein
MLKNDLVCNLVCNPYYQLILSFYCANTAHRFRWRWCVASKLVGRHYRPQQHLLRMISFEAVSLAHKANDSVRV